MMNDKKKGYYDNQKKNPIRIKSNLKFEEFTFMKKMYLYSFSMSDE